MQRPQTRAYDTFIRATLGRYLPECLKQVNNLRPRDPIEFIAQWLYKVYDSQLYYRAKVDYLSQLCAANSDITREKHEHANKLKPIMENIQAERWNYYMSLTQELEALTDYVSNEDVPVDEMSKRRFLEVQNLLKEETDYFSTLGPSQAARGETKHKTHRGKQASIIPGTLRQHSDAPQPSDSAQLSDSHSLLDEQQRQSSDIDQLHREATPTISGSSVLKRRSSVSPVEMTAKSSAHKSMKTDTTEAESVKFSRRPAHPRGLAPRRLPHEIKPRVSKNPSSRKPAGRSQKKRAQPSAPTARSDVNFDPEALSDLTSSSSRTQLGAETSSTSLERAGLSPAGRTLPGKSHVTSSVFFRYVLDGHLSDGSSSDHEFPRTSPHYVNSRDKDGSLGPARREFSERSSVRHSAAPALSGKKPRAVQLSAARPRGAENTSPGVPEGLGTPHLPTDRSLSDDKRNLRLKQPTAAHRLSSQSLIDESSADDSSLKKRACSSDVSKTASQTRGKQSEAVLGKDKVARSGIIHHKESEQWEEDTENMRDPREGRMASEGQDRRSQVCLPAIPLAGSISSNSSLEEAGRPKRSHKQPNSAVVELPAISSVGRAGTVVMTNAGHLAFVSREFGVIGSNSLKIRNVHPLDKPETWEKKYFQCQTFYDHELYSQVTQSDPSEDESEESSEGSSRGDPTAGSGEDPAAFSHGE